MEMIDERTDAIILAAGRGTRMNSTDRNKHSLLLRNKHSLLLRNKHSLLLRNKHSLLLRNKVALELNDRPMICYGVDLLKKVGFKPEQIVLVVGFASETVEQCVGKEVKYAYQEKQLGTGDAVGCVLKILPKSVESVLVMNGDDSAFYKAATIKNLINIYQREKPAFAFLSLNLDNPQIARVVRDHNGQVVKIVEQQDITPDEERIKEVNCGCYVFNVGFLKKYLPQIRLSPQGEYYLTSLFELAVRDNLKIANYKLRVQNEWVGINTPEQLQRARQLKKKESLC